MTPDPYDVVFSEWLKEMQARPDATTVKRPPLPGKPRTIGPQSAKSSLPAVQQPSTTQQVVEGIASVLPGSGEGMAAAETMNNARAGKMGGAAVSALGMLPVVGAMKKVGKVAKVAKAIGEEERAANLARYLEGSAIKDVVYHGTDKKFTKFDTKKATQGIHWFTSDRKAIEAGEVGAQGKGQILDLHASLKNPAGWKEYDKYSLGELRSMGYDGALLPDADGTVTGFVFEPTQLKSASRNRGTFDPTNPNITMGLAGAAALGAIGRPKPKKENQ